MALLPQERSKQYALLVGLAAIALIWVMYEYWHMPRTEEIASLEMELETLETQNRNAQIVAARAGPEMEERLAIYERHLGRLEELIPAEQEVSVLLNQIASEALRIGVDMGSVTPQPRQEGEFYTRETYDMTVIGEYHDVGRFLASVASLPRIITPIDLQVEPGPSSPVNEQMVSPVRARFQIETYLSPREIDPLAGGQLNNAPGGGR